MWKRLPCVACGRKPRTVLVWGLGIPILQAEHHHPDCPLLPAALASEKGR